MMDLLATGFVQKFLMAGSLLAILCGLLGCFLIWRRMTFFSDALSHASLLGVALALWFHVDLMWGVLGVCLVVALVLGLWAHQERALSLDTWLNVVSYGGLAGGMIALSQFPGRKIDPQSFLFGDPLSLTFGDIWIIAFCLLMTLLYILWNWRALLLVTLDAEMAKVHAISVRWIEGVLTLVLAVVVAIGLKTVGALLLPALMIFPAATWGVWARSPEGMVLGSSTCALICLWGGSMTSFVQDWPTGPSVILFALALFLSSVICKAIFRRGF